ncbi:MAG: uncharacterized protein JWM57_3845 [Phycisphaerales bacterium]|nr:uncharacterized protein [Phycisphaerales bacterium]
MPRSDLVWRIGSISFAYKDWRGVFYPPTVKPREYLTYYARQFDTIELDTTFHAVPPAERAAKWAEAVGSDFRFIAKIPKVISHEPGLESKGPQLIDFAEKLRPMRPKLALTLLQLPPTSGVEVAGPLNRLLDQVQHLLPIAVEVRHRTWFEGRALQALHDRGVTIVASDYKDRAQPIVGVRSLVYVRLIGEHERFLIKDHEQMDVQERLQWWVQQIEAKAAPNATVFATVSNDYAGHSPATVRRLRKIVGLPDTTPKPGSPEAQSLFE